MSAESFIKAVTTTLEFDDLEIGERYFHKTLGMVCTLLAPHPHDGACFVIEVETPEGDIGLAYCERHDLAPLVSVDVIES
jgi:hypothetical protein